MRGAHRRDTQFSECGANGGASRLNPPRRALLPYGFKQKSDVFNQKTAMKKEEYIDEQLSALHAICSRIIAQSVDEEIPF